jgi:hypothetical protein
MNSLLTVALIAALVSAPAFAQDGADPIMDAYAGKAIACLKAKDDASISPPARATLCQDDLTQLDAYFTSRTTSPHERNVYHFVRSFLQLQVGGAYLKIDAVRSQRVCTQTELTWSELAQVVDSNSPPAFQSNTATMRTSVVGPLGKCRGEFGTPPGAPPAS